MTTTATHFSQIIRAQIGVGALMATGARQFIYSDTEQYLQFTITGKRGYVTKIRVTLTADDLYTVQYGRMDKKTYDFEWLNEHVGIYAAELGETVMSLARGV